MNQIIELSVDDRHDVFNEAGAQLGLPPFYVEKDFWVCWALRLMFDHETMGPHLTFRGGTSLSKGWELIERFSEDVDLAMSRDWVDPDLPNPGEAGINTAERDRRLRRLRHACRKAISDNLVPMLEAEVAELGDGASVVVASLEKARDPFVIELHYPKGGLEIPGDYNRAVVKIELSGRADDWPQQERPITPYVAEAFPDLGTWAPIMIACVEPARTFWEKASLLHELYTRPDKREIAARHARHLYDLVRLWDHVADEPGLMELFTQVKAHRRAFFSYGWVDYEALGTADLVLVPPTDQLAAWRADYQAMGPMFSGDPPAFDATIESIKAIQAGLGALH